MKASHLLLISLGVIALGQMNAQNLTGSLLQVGSSNNMTSAQASGAFGSNNRMMGALSSLAIGDTNQMHNARFSVALGKNNRQQGSRFTLLIGETNSSPSTRYSLVVGEDNLLSEGTWSERLTRDSVVVGVDNVLAGAVLSSVAMGDENHLGEEQAVRSCMVALGAGLINRWNYSCVVGSLNDADHLIGEPVFVVGNGFWTANGTAVPSNALEVYKDGRIRMAPQGDISMGEFGAGE